MEHSYSFGEAFIGVMGVLLTISFGLWAGIVKRAAEGMEKHVDKIVEEIKGLRDEIHKDRVLNERRFVRLEQHTGINGD